MDMFCAISEGDTAALTSLLRDLDLTTIPSSGAGEVMMALCHAARKGQVACLRLLLGTGVDWSRRRESGYDDPILVAVTSGQPEALEVLLSAGDDLDLNQGRDEDGRMVFTSPLVRALKRDSGRHYRCAELLLDHGASTHIATYQGLTPLMVASTVGRTAMLERLLEAGDYVDRADELGNRALALAAKNGKADAVRCLLAHGARVDARNREGMTALMIATQGGHFESVRILLEEGNADVHALSWGNNSALMFLPADGCDIANRLCECSKRRLWINKRNHDGETALMRVLKRHRMEVSEGLLGCLRKLGADVNRADRMGNTPLLRAISSQTDKVVCWLLDAGAKVNVSGSGGDTPLLLAANFDRPEVIRMLTKFEVKLDVMDKQGNSPLMLALARHASLETIDLLIDLESDVNLQNRDQRTALMIACSAACTTPGDDSRVLKLLRAGSNPCLSDETGRTALSLAIFRKNVLACHALLEFAATSCPVSSPELHQAVVNGLSSVVEKMLVHSGVLPSLQLLSSRDGPQVFRNCPLSPFFTALLVGDLRVAQLFASVDFFVQFDSIESSSELKLSLLNRLEDEGKEQILGVARSVYCQPWSLWGLSFLKVSTCVGFESDRQLKLSRTGLPTSLQRKLMFKV